MKKIIRKSARIYIFLTVIMMLMVVSQTSTAANAVDCSYPTRTRVTMSFDGYSDKSSSVSLSDYSISIQFKNYYGSAQTGDLLSSWGYLPYGYTVVFDSDGTNMPVSFEANVYLNYKLYSVSVRSSGISLGQTSSTDSLTFVHQTQVAIWKWPFIITSTMIKAYVTVTWQEWYFSPSRCFTQF